MAPSSLLATQLISGHLDQEFRHQQRHLHLACHRAQEGFLRITEARSDLRRSKLANTAVRQPVRQYAPTELVMAWRKLQAGEQHQGSHGGHKKSGQAQWVGELSSLKQFLTQGADSTLFGFFWKLLRCCCQACQWDRTPST